MSYSQASCTNKYTNPSPVFSQYSSVTNSVRLSGGDFLSLYRNLENENTGDINLSGELVPYLIMEYADNYFEGYFDNDEYNSTMILFFKKLFTQIINDVPSNITKFREQLLTSGKTENIIASFRAYNEFIMLLEDIRKNGYEKYIASEYCQSLISDTGKDLNFALYALYAALLSDYEVYDTTSPDGEKTTHTGLDLICRQALHRRFSEAFSQLENEVGSQLPLVCRYISHESRTYSSKSSKIAVMTTLLSCFGVSGFYLGHVIEGLMTLLTSMFLILFLPFGSIIFVLCTQTGLILAAIVGFGGCTLVDGKGFVLSGSRKDKKLTVLSRFVNYGVAGLFI